MDMVGGSVVYVKAAVILTDFIINAGGAFADEKDAIYSVSSEILNRSPSYTLSSSLTS